MGINCMLKRNGRKLKRESGLRIWKMVRVRKGMGGANVSTGYILRVGDSTELKAGVKEHYIAYVGSAGHQTH